MSASNSSRFLVQMVMNVFICNYAQKKIAKITAKKQGKKALKSYIFFFLFALILIALNQAVFFMFTPNNIYQQLAIRRSATIQDVKKYKDDLKIKIMSIQELPINQRMQNIKKMQAMADVLTHPARRLSYDTFGQTDTSYAWAFKSSYYLLSTIIGSSIFYVICTILNMIGQKKGEIKQAFKMQIMVMIILFLWEVQLIMRTEDRLHQPTDLLDSIYPAFPIFQRRQMIKIILIPCMNIIKFFFRFFIQNQTQKRFLKLAKNPKLRQLTLKISQSINKQVNIQDEHVEDRVEVALSETKKNYPLHTDIYAIQRKVIQSMLYVEGDNVLYDEQVAIILRYFMISLRDQHKK